MTWSELSGRVTWIGLWQRIYPIFLVLLFERVGCILSAQEMPDSVWGLWDGDTMSLAVHKGFSGGWSVRLFWKGPPWQEVARDTLLLDTAGRLICWTRHCQTPFFWPCARLTCTYAGKMLYCTRYRYEEPVFVPEERLYAWGLSSEPSVLLSGVLAEAIWGSSPDTLSSIWPFPRLWKRAHWADSVLNETFSPTYQVFVENGGFRCAYQGMSCDSFQLYEGAYFFPAASGSASRCFSPDGLLTVYEDSLCDTAFCWLRQRVLSYQDGWLTADTLRWQVRTRAGVPVRSFQYISRYQYDLQGRLTGVEAPRRRYRLSYGGEVLALPLPLREGVRIHHSSGARWIRVEGLSAPASLQVYDMAGRLVAAEEITGEGTYGLPSLQTGPYLLRVEGTGLPPWQKLILLME